jgi:hypothetical protein
VSQHAGERGGIAVTRSRAVVRAPARSAAIDARSRARRIANLRNRQAFARQSEAERRARLDALAKLAGTLDAGTFSADELRDAEAALLQSTPTSRQASLALSSVPHA